MKNLLVCTSDFATKIMSPAYCNYICSLTFPSGVSEVWLDRAVVEQGHSRGWGSAFTKLEDPVKLTIQLQCAKRRGMTLLLGFLWALDLHLPWMNTQWTCTSLLSKLAMSQSSIETLTLVNQVTKSMSMKWINYDILMQSLNLASFPGPPQLSVVSSMVKQERAWYIFSHEWHQDRKDGRKGLIVHVRTGPRTAKEPSYQVVYHMYLASGRQLCYTPSIECVYIYIYHCKKF